VARACTKDNTWLDGKIRTARVVGLGRRGIKII